MGKTTDLNWLAGFLPSTVCKTSLKGWVSWYESKAGGENCQKCLDFVLGCPMNQTELNEKVPGVTILQGSLNYLF